MKKKTLRNEVEEQLLDNEEELDPRIMYPKDPVEISGQDAFDEAVRLDALNLILKCVTGRNALEEITNLAKQSDASDQDFIELLKELYPSMTRKDTPDISLLINFYNKKSEENADDREEAATTVGFCERKPNLDYYDWIFSGCPKMIYDPAYWQ